MKYFRNATVGSVCLLLLLHLGIVHTALRAQTVTETADENPTVEPAYTDSDLYSDEETLERMQTRRSMLEWHQLAGFVTWGLWLATNLEGERIAGSHRRVGEDSMRLLWLSDPDRYTPLYLLYQENAERHTTKSSSTHIGLAAATGVAYAITASLALFAPSVYDAAEHDGFDSIWWHKALAFIHLAAMIALPALAHRAEEGPEGVQTMRNVGWTGFGALSMSIAVLYF